MTPQFHPSLVNGPFDDPVLYIDFLHDRRALLSDLEDVYNEYLNKGYVYAKRGSWPSSSSRS